MKIIKLMKKNEYHEPDHDLPDTHPDCLDQDYVVPPGLAEEDGLVGRPRHSAQVTS